jgi:hypothetical protein
MHSIHSHQELLYSLARNGDPSAFYTLVIQFANAAYIAERNSGKSHKETLAILIPFIKKAYQNFITTIHQNPFDVWYREYKRKYFHTADRSATSPAPNEANFETMPMADIAHFGSLIDLVLQRQYGKHLRTKKGLMLLRLSEQFAQLPWLLKGAFVLALIGMLLVMLLCFFAITKKQFIMTYVSGGSRHTLVLPFPANAPMNGDASFSQFSGIKNAPANTQDSVAEKIHDTLLVHDTIRIMPPRKNSSIPPNANKSGMPVSPGTSKAMYDSLQ